MRGKPIFQLVPNLLIVTLLGMVSSQLSANDDLEKLLDRQQIESNQVLEQVQKRFGVGGGGHPKAVGSDGRLTTVLSFSDSVYHNLEPFRRRGVEGTKQLLWDQIDQHPLPLVGHFPPEGLVDFTAELLANPTALPSLAKIIERPGKLRIFLWIVLGSFIFGVVWRLFSPSRRAFKAILAYWWRFLVLNSIRIGGFLYLFHGELKPIWRLLRARYF